MPAENLVTLEAGLALVRGLRSLSRRDKKDHRLNDNICRALRMLYFPPDGVLALLKEVSRGNGVPSDELRTRLISFNDREWEVGRALDAIDFAELQRDLRLSLATARALEQIRHGKIDLRREIQAEVNYYGRRGVKADLKVVRSLIAAIEKLNAEIEEAERVVNSRALER